MQLTRLHRGRGALKHDDRIDALAAAVEFYKEHMQLDTEKSSEDNKRKEWEKRVKNWAENFRAGDYIPSSGALKLISTNHKKPRKNQWGW
jgi:hypothetical protein